VYVCMYVCVYMHVFICMYVCMYECVCMYVCMDRCLFVCMYKNTNELSNNTNESANNTNESRWETLAQPRLIARTCALFKTHTGGRAWKAIEDRLLKPCYLSRKDHNRKIRIRKQRTDVGKYSFVNRTVNRWN
jgi:hypothetical protein